jgi:hypothetical protein
MGPTSGTYVVNSRRDAITFLPEAENRKLHPFSVPRQQKYHIPSLAWCWQEASRVFVYE